MGKSAERHWGFSASAIITATPAPGGPAGDLPGHAVACARAAGLTYAQHIVLVHAAIDGDHLTPQPDPGPGPDPGQAPGDCPAGGHAHGDLLVFTRPGGAPAHD